MGLFAFRRRIWVDHYMGHMPTPITLFAAAMLTISLATVVVNVEASHAADDCLAGPNAAAPQGGHWYYRVDRTTHRECWYLGPEGREVSTRAHQGGSPVRSYPSNEMGAQPASQTPAQAATAKAAMAEPSPSGPVPVEITFGRAKTSEDNSTERAMRWSGIAASTASLDPGLVSNRDSYEVPILSPAELPAAAEPASDLPILAQLGAVFAVVLGLAAILGRVIFKFFAVRGLGRSLSRDRGGWAPSTHRRSKQMPSRVANMAAEGHQDGMACSEASSPPSDLPTDLESGVRRLLHELHRRQHEHERRPSSRLDPHLDAGATSDVLLKAAEAIERLKGLDVRAACRRARELPAA
jgi:hypothetical protein